MNIIGLLSPDVLNKEVDNLGETIEAGEKPLALRLKDNNEADECLGRILWAQETIAKNDELVKEKKAQLLAQLEDYDRRLSGRLRNYLAYQQAILKAYLYAHFGKDENGSQKTGTLPLFNGNVRLKAPSESLVVDDEDAAVKWLKENGFNDAVIIKESVKKSDAKKLFKRDESGRYLLDKEGNVIHGMHIDKEDGLQLAITAPKDKKTKAA